MEDLMEFWKSAYPRRLTVNAENQKHNIRMRRNFMKVLDQLPFLVDTVMCLSVVTGSQMKLMVRAETFRDVISSIYLSTGKERLIGMFSALRGIFD